MLMIKIARLTVVVAFYLTLSAHQPVKLSAVTLIVLGTIQDGGSPHIGCNKSCCRDLFLHPDYRRKVVSLGVIDPQNRQTWLFEATPDMPAQAKMLKNAAGFQQKETPDGIFVTHAHIGHYTGLMYLGKEAMNSKAVPAYAMPRMKTFLENNGPWNQLVNLNNIAIQALQNEQQVVLSSNVKVTPIIVPHRDELSETVGYRIEGPNKKILFIPDINKWALWNKDIAREIATVDYAFVDGTFYSGDEIQTRNIAEIPHPFIIESMQLLSGLPAREKGKVYFIHFNHTNPVINPKSKEALTVLRNGFHIAQFGQRVVM
ncbi:MAG: MBL fold metallo-hydrolase [Bacteroidota bacterium]